MKAEKLRLGKASKYLVRLNKLIFGRNLHLLRMRDRIMSR
jgi:hypothetical protein